MQSHRKFPPLNVLVFCVLASPALAHSATWREVGGLQDDGIVVKVDDASLMVEKDVVVRGWVRFDYMSPRLREGQTVTAYSSYRIVNCDTQRYWITESWGYPLESAEPVPLYSSSQEWRIAPPDSEAEIANVALCYETKSLFGIVWEKMDVKHHLAALWEKIKKGVSRVNDYNGTGATLPAEAPVDDTSATPQ